MDLFIEVISFSKNATTLSVVVLHLFQFYDFVFDDTVNRKVFLIG